MKKGRPKIDKAREARLAKINRLNEGIIASYYFLDNFKRQKEKLEELNRINRP